MGKVCGEHSRATVMSKQRAKARHQTYILKKEYEINSSYEEEEKESTIIILEGRKKGSRLNEVGGLEVISLLTSPVYVSYIFF